jgi:cell division protein FtsL
VFLLIKRFDNTGVVRQADPHAGKTAWKAIGGSCIAATLLIGLLLPGAYRLLAGYRIDQLKQAREESIRELRTLEYDEARLIRMERVNEVARSREFAAPTSEQVQFVQPKDSVASLRKP